MTTAAPPDPNASDTHVAPPSMPPGRRRAVLAVLWVVFALWVAALLAMYFGTVYPQRHPKDGRPAVVAPPAR